MSDAEQSARNKITPLINHGGALRYHDLLHHNPALNAADPAGGAGVLRHVLASRAPLAAAYAGITRC